ncbi:hypothetical protein [Enterovirga rhinocerotis]|uniref:Uncharacterized protein n=1 Tax=Enterovirga rhinocerotis TaxID=1339210 RepID=A0A4R7BJL1_9HYPH|nr:hypothetical protein [Enterovirga rhinocerotis]TDR85183.1 hypothetical protein EV668_4727 [Enterovirga rhinocerotis]
MDRGEEPEPIGSRDGAGQATPLDTEGEAGQQRRASKRRPAGWALGLPALALLAAVAAMRISPAIEINIRREAARLAKHEPDSPLARSGARFAVDGRDVRIVTDTELPDGLRGETEARTGAIPAVRLVRSEATGYVTLSPFPFAVRRSDTGIVLDGAVPDAKLRAALVEQAARYVPADQVEDRLRLAAGAPDGFAEAARFLLATLAPLSLAEGTLSGRTLQANASPEDPASYNAVMLALRNVPKGFSGAEHDIRPPRITPFVWTARRDGGGLALGGLIPSEALRLEVTRLAATMLPSLPVRDSMQTARGLDRSIDFLASARAAFEALSQVQRGEAQLAERRFSLSGETVARNGVAAIERRVRETLPHALGAPMLSVAVVPASPFVFRARRVEGRVELGGYLTSDGDRAAILGLIGTRFPGEKVVDSLVTADGAPDGFKEVARAALETLSDFAEGEVALADSNLRLTGQVLYPQLAARIRRSVPAMVPPGWRAGVELEPVQRLDAVDAHLCGDLLSDVARRNPVRFAPGEAAPEAGATPALEAAAEIVRRCGRVGIRVVHHIAAPAGSEAARDLAAGRAGALVTALSERGATARFTVEGVVAPVAAGSAGAQGRTEFIVTPL